MKRPNLWSTKLLPALLAVLIIAAVGGCARDKTDQPNKPVSRPAMTTPGRLSGPMDVELLQTAASSESVKKIQEDGILVASLKCDFPRLCERNKSGAPVGLEVDLLKRIAAQLGVKLNIVSEGPASVYGPGSAAPKGSIVAGEPFFYSESDGWLRFSVAGDAAFEKTVSGMINSLYETGTYQQLYKNHFAEDARAPGEGETGSR